MGKTTVNARLDSESFTGGERGWTKVCCEKSSVFLTGPACRIGLAPDGDVPAGGLGGLWTHSIWLSAGLFLPLPGPSDFILQCFRNKIIHTVLHMLLSHQHHHPTQT